MVTDVELLNSLKKHFDMANDYQLCDLLGMSRSQISAVRAKSNPRPLTSAQRVMAYDHLGYAWAREAMLALFPTGLKIKLRTLDIEKTKAHAATDKPKHAPGLAKEGR